MLTKKNYFACLKALTLSICIVGASLTSAAYCQDNSDAASPTSAPAAEAPAPVDASGVSNVVAPTETSTSDANAPVDATGTVPGSTLAAPIAPPTSTTPSQSALDAASPPPIDPTVPLIPEGVTSTTPAVGAPSSDKAKDLNKETKEKIEASDKAEAVKESGKEPLKGGVTGAVLRTEDGLEKIGETAMEVNTWSIAIVTEATRKNVVNVRSPNYLPGGTVINPMPGPSGELELGVLPIRRKRLDRFMSSIEQMMTVLDNQINGLIIPEDKAKIIADPWERIHNLRNSAKQHIENLQKLSLDTRLDNTKITREAAGVHDDMIKLYKYKRQVQRIIAPDAE